MSYLLDSDWLIDFLGGDPAAQRLVAPLFADGLAITFITFIEIYEGIERSASPRQEERSFRAFLRAARVLPVNRSVARRAATVRVQLRSQGRSVRNRALDLLIAATAIQHNLTLVSRNTDDYRDIPGLKLY